MRDTVGWLLPDVPDANSRAALSTAFGAEAQTRAISIGRMQVIVPDRVRHGVARTGRGAVLLLGNPRTGAPQTAALRGDALAEWLLREFEARGIGALSALNGPFALVIVQADAQTALFATDKVGVQPLYYSATPRCVMFSTSLAAFRRHPTTRPTWRPQSVFDYLYFHVVPGPRTIYAEVERVEPGCAVTVGGGVAAARRYWTIGYSNESGAASSEAQQAEFRRVLEQSVAVSSAEDRSVGCFLSGGTDSSTVSGTFGRLSGRGARTYSIGFDVPGFDEMRYARIAASHFGTDHHEYYVTAADVVDLTPRIAETYGSPFGNASAVPTYYCARMARADGIELMLAGDGGDELFGGNQRYATQRMFALYDALPDGVRRVVEPIALNLPFSERVWPLRKIRRYVEQASVPMPERLEGYNYLHHFDLHAMFESDFLSSVAPDLPRSERRAHYDAADARSALNRMLALDLKYTLADNDLPKVSVMCGLAGVDVAYPFLQDEMVALSAALPDVDKVRGTRLRPFFKDALSGVLPPEIIAKQKHGFGLPIGDWLATDARLSTMAADLLSTLKRRGIVQSRFIDDLLGVRLREHAKYYGGFAWVLMMLETWFEYDER